MSGFDSSADLDDEQATALESLLLRLADDEFVLAERYTEWQVRAPSLESDLALSNNAQDELGHARLWYDVLEDLGHEEHELIYERDPDEWRHSTLTERPFDEGDWADVVLRHYLYDVAEQLRLESLAESSYAKIADRVGKVRSEEQYHREHAESWMERLADGDEGHERLQNAVDRLFPHALTLFEVAAPTSGTGDASGDEPRAVDDDLEETIVEAGFRDASLEALRAEWLSIVVPYLEDLDLETPVSEIVHYDDYDLEVPDDTLPEALGRDGTHTDAWAKLHEEFTHTYRELERSEATTIMAHPE
ncbi:1,2-phenylacetyl-CoA epoxidase subunit PaaC [Natronobacterium gregoryi]|uniref:Phenylacetate-CoA oxygenase subunit PaaI n=2 Tax=Natronobacterium gregoryi TaxID=44930 RepID=L0AHC0_NATGS|nr:1,2-phenylacetyl-CoA epoxidase subunit PaaC [Natronobacterium gregoryi]AFZ72470.1 phenylacetate-CoA oxygenase, PaaI subunit [Natronobacterium gregoryi SP2]ELY74340.1 phenylacetate-CoA oxygenase subunit PaaI [Natronobacterium gregoryi SP2]PLK21442.1 phenylacetate-CoA oxygenase subunit PaaI [Natronobacterium gregoryi SP2]SFI77721.1 ring-1,2-phenylacetyl-CoA epoxidase subunit PaaC [Natronobacterium gregoryi]